MRLSRSVLLAAGTAALVVCVGSPALGAPGIDRRDHPSDLGRQVLPVNDGWASAEGGTSGGSAATADHVYHVHDRNELASALADAGDAPKIIYVHGTIDANVDDANNPLTCADYAAGTGYTLDGYMAAFNQEVWTWSDQGATVEAQRAAAERNQAARVLLSVPSNTTIVGVGGDAIILGGDFDVHGVDNVIIRNLALHNAFDCFPEWSPDDNNPAPATPGNWNSEFDSITVKGSTHVWIDHNTLTDLPHPDSEAPTYFNRPFQQHDGASDITGGSDLVTVSWNTYVNHDKTMLIGSTDKPTTDVGKLNVTIHHNEFDGILERAPRLRWGHADVYDNYYVVSADSGYQYSWGVGVNSHIYAENNYFALGDGVDASRILYNWRGHVVHTVGNVVNREKVDILAAFNAANPDARLADDTSWVPTLRTQVHPAQAVPAIVGNKAGSGRL